MSRFEASTLLAPTYLDEQSPLGLVQALGIGVSELFWVHEHDNRKWAIVLGAGRNEQFLFDAWRLEGSSQNWQGLSLGAVELLLDVDSAVRGDHQQPATGTVFIQRDQVFLKVKSGQYRQTLNIRIGDSAPSPHPELILVFSNWQLVQYDRLGKTRILFTKNPEAQ